MKVIIAQGNPGKKYQFTRHNIGFLALDVVAKQHGAVWTEKSKFHAHVCEMMDGDEKILFVKPNTFYNETGRSVKAIVDFYKLDPTNDILIIHDDLALPFGTIRTRKDGSPAGNNGIKSINSLIDSQYARIRIGILNSMRDDMNDSDFVLAAFNTDEKSVLPKTIGHVHTLIHQFTDSTLTDHTATLKQLP